MCDTSTCNIIFILLLAIAILLIIYLAYKQTVVVRNIDNTLSTNTNNNEESIISIDDANSNTEGFYNYPYNYPGYYKKHCSICSDKGSYNCSQCTNCGICIDFDGSKTCVAGDRSGPYYKSNCWAWEYGSPYDFYKNSNIYPIVSIHDRYPYRRWNNTGTRWQQRNNNRYLRNKRDKQ